MDPNALAHHARYVPGQRRGHYESFFQRGNHPSRPLAFWIRHMVFQPEGQPEAAVGELWAVWFDGEDGRHVAVREEHPIADCHFDRAAFDVWIAASTLGPGALRGEAATGNHRIAWDLGWGGGQPPLLLFPTPLYRTALPKAKALVGTPQARWRGALVVDGERHPVDGWVGSENHNWGSRHTDHYAWGQVAGFDDAPDTFLEVGTGQIRIGPVWTPPLTPLVLRHEGVEYRMNRRIAWTGTFAPFSWTFRGTCRQGRLEGRIDAAPDDFVALPYANPPGGVKWCLNTKIASCEVTLSPRRGPPVTLRSAHRAAFEILTDDPDHGVRRGL